MHTTLIGNILPRIQYVGDGTTRTFFFPFQIFNNENLIIYIGHDRQLNNYRVSGVLESGGGSVTFDEPPQKENLITIRRIVSLKRITRFAESGFFGATDINREFDNNTAALQDISFGFNQCVKISETDDINVSLTLPNKTNRANKLLAFDSSGSILAVDRNEGTASASAHGALTGLADDDHAQYHTAGRADAWLATKTTDALTEGATNKYFPGFAGSGASPFAARADHSHDGVYEPAFTKNTGFNKNFGTGAGTVAEGDHGHSHFSDTANPHSVTKAQVGLGEVQDLKVNLTATFDPTVTADAAAGYAVGSRWVNVTTDNEFVCLDAANGAAVWKLTTASGGAGSTNLSIANRTAAALDVTSDTGTDATVPAATTSLAGLLTSTDKTKLDGIAEGAQVNTVSSVHGRTGAVVAASNDYNNTAQTGMTLSLPRVNQTVYPHATAAHAGGAVSALDFQSKSVLQLTLNGNITGTLPAPTNAPAVASSTAPLVLRLVQDGTGGRTVAAGAWTTNYQLDGAEPAVPTAAGDFVDIVLTRVNDGSSTFWVVDGDTKFTDLGDSPSSYSGQGGKVLAVKGDETGVEFIAGGAGETNLGANVGSGEGLVFRDKTGVTLNFKRLLAGSNVTITNGADDVTIASSGGGGGGSSTDPAICEARAPGTQTSAVDSTVTVALDAALFADTGYTFSDVNDEITVADAGRHTITYMVSGTGAAAGYWEAFLEKDSGGGYAELAGTRVRAGQNSGIEGGCAALPGRTFTLAAGDKIRLRVDNPVTEGATITIAAASFLKIQKGGGAAYCVVPVYRSNTPQTIAGDVEGVAETTVLSYTMPANALGANGGYRIRMTGGIFNNAGAGDQGGTIRVKIGATTILEKGFDTINAATQEAPLDFDFELGPSSDNTARASGGGTFLTGRRGGSGVGIGNLTGSSPKGSTIGTDGEITSGIDWTADQALTITVQLASASANLWVRWLRKSIELIPAVS